MAPGYWGSPTATLDWCEENYAVTHFIAEFCKYFVICNSSNSHFHLQKLGSNQ